MTHRPPVSPPPAPVRRPRPPGAGGFYAVAFLALAVSLNTSWRFFGEVLGITSVPERVVLFAVLEAGLVACGAGMRAGVRASGQPGPSRLLAWALAGFSGYVALVLSGPVAGLARVVLGPLLSLVALHLALGLELRHARGGARTGTLARVRRELRERALSRLGLAHEGRSAVALTRDHARTRAVRLASARWVVARRARLRRALRVGRVAGDPTATHQLLNQLAVARHAATLVALELASPWGPAEARQRPRDARDEGHGGPNPALVEGQVRAKLGPTARGQAGATLGPSEGQVRATLGPGRGHFRATLGPNATSEAVAPEVAPGATAEGQTGASEPSVGPPEGQTGAILGPPGPPDDPSGATTGELALVASRARDQVTAVVALMDLWGPEAVTLAVVETRLALSSSTAKRRLRLARQAWREREGE